eukprot:11021735-Alexandrium_andersonii.AAC.1
MCIRDRGSEMCIRDSHQPRHSAPPAAPHQRPHPIKPEEVCVGFAGGGAEELPPVPPDEPADGL